MNQTRCAANCNCGSGRREFIKKTALLGTGAVFINPVLNDILYSPGLPIIKKAGPASKYTPFVKAAFVRRKEDYGMLWPGAVYDGETAKTSYTEGLKEAATKTGIRLEMREDPIYSLEEAELWTKEAVSSKTDGIFLVVLDRQQHAWPTAAKVAETGIPSIIYSPLGTSFTTNTINLADKQGCVIFSTDDFSQAVYGLKMLKANALISKTRCVVIAGNERTEKRLSSDTGITLQYIPADTFIKTYNKMPVSPEVKELADEYISKALLMKHATKEDVLNGIKSYIVAGKILEDEQADAISMDCLGALGKIPVSLPCIAWSRMNDDGIPAACEADTGAIAAHVILQNLFDRPGFQQDPVADTADDTLIGAHCSCPTRLNGFSSPPEPFEIIHHHGNRDAVPRTIWKTGQRITCMDFLPEGTRSRMLISTGTVVDNLNVPPSGGCVVSVKAKMDSNQSVLSFPGFHQLFFYGDYKRELKAFCQLSNYEAIIV
jgi:hypothetical protein